MFSNAANNSIPFSEADLKRALASSEGRQLLALLSRSGGGTLQQAMQAAKKGDYNGAKALIEPMLKNPEAEKLLEKLNQKTE